MNTVQILIAGFGGQGVLFAGKFIAYKGLLEGRQLSWLPSYGPEMRGGTANCSVMNLPSLDKYEGAAKSGAQLFVDSTLIERKVKRTDVTAFYIPATRMAQEAGIPTLANMIMVGKMIRETGMVSFENIREALSKVVSAKHADLLEVNLKAIETGYRYEG